MLHDGVSVRLHGVLLMLQAKILVGLFDRRAFVPIITVLDNNADNHYGAVDVLEPIIEQVTI